MAPVDLPLSESTNRKLSVAVRKFVLENEPFLETHRNTVHYEDDFVVVSANKVYGVTTIYRKYQNDNYKFVLRLRADGVTDWDWVSTMEIYDYLIDIATGFLGIV